MKTDQMVGARLPEDMVRDLEVIERCEQTDRSTAVRKLLWRAIRDWKVEHYARDYGRGVIGVGRAAEAAGVSVWEMLMYVRQHKIGAQYDLEELRHDLTVVLDSAAGTRPDETTDAGANATSPTGKPR